MGSSHAIYNLTDAPVQWMNINVTAFRGVYDAFDLGDGRVGAPLDPVPQFMAMRLDTGRLQQVESMQGGKGTVQSPRPPVKRVPLDLGVCRSPAAAARRPGRSCGRAGGRRVLLRDNRRRHGHCRSGKRPDQSRRCGPDSRRRGKFREHHGTAPLEFLVVGIARDVNKKNDMLASPPQRIGGPGRGRGRGQ